MFNYGQYMPPRGSLPFTKDENGLDYEDIMEAQRSGTVKRCHNREVLGY
jgi:hypothetical protein